MFHSAHYAGIDLCPRFRDQEPWQKVFGPIFIYLNSAPLGTDKRSLWDDAKQQVSLTLFMLTLCTKCGPSVTVVYRKKLDGFVYS